MTINTWLVSALVLLFNIASVSAEQDSQIQNDIKTQDDAKIKNNQPANTESVKYKAVSSLGAFTGLKTDILVGEIDGISLSVNIAMPKRKSIKARPVLVMVHGGGLIKGNKDLLNKRIQKIAKQGFVGVSVGYRLAPTHRFPAAIEDVKASIRFLKAYAKELNIDPNRIIVSGSSAGAYLATMIGVTGNSNKFSKHKLYSQYDSSVRAVTSYSGSIADFNQSKYHDYSLMKRFVREDVDLNVGLAELSPITYLDKDDPAFFLVHGSADERVPVEMSQDFVQALLAIEHEYDYIEIEGGKHSLKNSRPKKASEAFAAYLSFIKKHGFPQKGY